MTKMEGHECNVGFLTSEWGKYTIRIWGLQEDSLAACSDPYIFTCPVSQGNSSLNLWDCIGIVLGGLGGLSK